MVIILGNRYVGNVTICHDIPKIGPGAGGVGGGRLSLCFRFAFWLHSESPEEAKSKIRHIRGFHLEPFLVPRRPTLVRARYAWSSVVGDPVSRLQGSLEKALCWLRFFSVNISIVFFFFFLFSETTLLF